MPSLYSRAAHLSAVSFGHVPGSPPGSHFPDRIALAEAGVHRARRAGIAGRAQEGAESVVLSGGYEDDEDRGDVIIYTGSGGRDRRTGRQAAHQTLTRANLALANSLRHGLPVRVVRGAHPDVHDPPEAGYRYDGLYRVTDYWQETGAAGFTVWRFRLVRLGVEAGGASGQSQNTASAVETSRSTS